MPKKLWDFRWAMPWWPLALRSAWCPRLKDALALRPSQSGWNPAASKGDSNEGQESDPKKTPTPLGRRCRRRNQEKLRHLRDYSLNHGCSTTKDSLCIEKALPQIKSLQKPASVVQNWNCDCAGWKSRSAKLDANGPTPLPRLLLGQVRFYRASSCKRSQKSIGVHTSSKSGFAGLSAFSKMSSSVRTPTSPTKRQPKPNQPQAKSHGVSTTSAAKLQAKAPKRSTTSRSAQSTKCCSRLLKQQTKRGDLSAALYSHATMSENLFRFKNVWMRLLKLKTGIWLPYWSSTTSAPKQERWRPSRRGSGCKGNLKSRSSLLAQLRTGPRIRSSLRIVTRLGLWKGKCSNKPKGGWWNLPIYTYAACGKLQWVKTPAITRETPTLSLLRRWLSHPQRGPQQQWFWATSQREDPVLLPSAWRTGSFLPQREAQGKPRCRGV